MSSIKANIKTNFKRLAVVMALPGESQGIFERDNIKVFYTGIGKVNAAFTAAEVIQKTQCDILLNLGSAGSARFKTHDLVECSSFVQRDMDISPLGFKVGETPFDEIPGEILADRFFPELQAGICGTGDSFETGICKVACDLVDMEAYAIAKVCKKKSVQFISLKYITDGADHNAHNDWEANLVPGAVKLYEYFNKVRLLF